MKSIPKCVSAVVLCLKLFTPYGHAQQPPPLILSNVWSATNGDVVPLSGFAGTIETTLSSDIARFRYTGADGYLEYQWQRPLGSTPLFGTLTLSARMTGGSVVTLPIATTAGLTWTQAATVLSNAWEVASDSITLVRWYKVPTLITVVRIKGQMVGKSLVLTVTCDRSVVSLFNGGLWGGTQQQINVPYYGTTIRYVPAQNLFVNAFLDWTSSSASSESGTVATYGALTDGSRNLLQERMIYTAAWHLNEVFPNLPAPASPWREHLADKMILDIWGDEPFTNIARGINDLAEYDVTNCIVIVHGWQRMGYDNGLPLHFPASDYWGGDAEMTNLAATVTGYGMRFALHENYVDYYENYPGWDPLKDVSWNSDGTKVLAWRNPYSGVQSYAENPNSMVTLASSQSPQIHSRYRTGASFLDVHSAVPPWFHVNFRAGQTGAGMARRVWEAHRQLWEYERTAHEGPVFGEGGSHWYWTGYLDGVEAQFNFGGQANQGVNMPLYVDFDLLKMHPLQLNHGMGYYQRWGDAAASASLPPMVMLDQYRMQQVVFGHAAYRTGEVGWDSVPAGWLEQNLMIPVTARYATSKPVEILYQFSGAWINATTLAKSGAFPSRVRVQYENGLVITINSDVNTLQAGVWQLPQFGWVAEGAGVTAGTTLRNGIISDFSDTPNRLFVNARPATDWNFGPNYTGSLGSRYREHLNLNNAVVNFGDIRTSGSALLRREGNQWVLKTWPREKNFVVELNAQRFGQPPQVTCVGGANSTTTATPLAGGWWSLALNGAREYRWSESDFVEPPVATFVAGPTNGPAPLTVSFTNLSTSATYYTWNFGDGKTSTATNSINTYTNAGIYTVSLTAIGPTGTNSITNINYIVITNVAPVADFAAGPTNGMSPLTVIFTNLSTTATSYIWNFGDGHVSTATNAANTYSNAGSYTVSLQAVGLGGANILVRNDYVVLSNAPPALTPIANRMVLEETPLTFTASAADPDTSQVLQFSLDPGAPQDASINATTGEFVWLPSSAYASTTSSITVRVSDDGTPPATDTETITVTVVAKPRLLMVSESPEGVFTLVWKVYPGRTYRCEFKDRIADPDWTPLGPDKTATTSSLTTTNHVSTSLQRFFHLLDVAGP